MPSLFYGMERSDKARRSGGGSSSARCKLARTSEKPRAAKPRISAESIKDCTYLGKMAETMVQQFSQSDRDQIGSWPKTFHVGSLCTGSGLDWWVCRAIQHQIETVLGLSIAFCFSFLIEIDGKKREWLKDFPISHKLFSPKHVF